MPRLDFRMHEDCMTDKRTLYTRWTREIAEAMWWWERNRCDRASFGATCGRPSCRHRSPIPLRPPPPTDSLPAFHKVLHRWTKTHYQRLYTRLYSGNLLLSSSWILERRQEGRTRSSKLCACSLQPLQIRAHGPQTNDFKFSLARTKELATRLPGGELTLDEQDEIIQMLEAVRDGKK